MFVVRLGVLHIKYKSPICCYNTSQRCCYANIVFLTIVRFLGQVFYIKRRTLQLPHGVLTEFSVILYENHLHDSQSSLFSRLLFSMSYAHPKFRFSLFILNSRISNMLFYEKKKFFLLFVILMQHFLFRIFGDLRLSVQPRANFLKARTFSPATIKTF